VLVGRIGDDRNDLSFPDVLQKSINTLMFIFSFNAKSKFKYYFTCNIDGTSKERRLFSYKSTRSHPSSSI
jgi:hypothetical protein